MRADHLCAAAFIVFMLLAMTAMAFIGPWVNAALSDAPWL